MTCIFSYFKRSLGADESEDGDFFYNEEEVLHAAGAETRAALLERYDAMLDDSEQPDLEEVCYTQLFLPCYTSASAVYKYSCPSAADCK